MKMIIYLKVQNGEYSHVDTVLHETKGKNAEFIANRYASTYYGYGERFDDGWMFHGGEIGVRLQDYKVLTDKEYEVLKNYL